MTGVEEEITKQTTSFMSFLEDIAYLSPFIVLGLCGGTIRAINAKAFTWSELFKRAMTGAFGAALVGLYLKHLDYSIEMQYAIAGAVGAVACELISAIKLWVIRTLGGSVVNGLEENSNGSAVGDNSLNDIQGNNESQTVADNNATTSN